MALNFYKYKTFVVFKSVTFSFYKFKESVGDDAINDLQEDLKIFKSDTFENYKSFVPADVQSLCIFIEQINYAFSNSF